MAITKMTPAQIKKINNEIKKALAGVEKQFGISIDFGNSTYQQTEYKTKMTVSIAGENGIKKIIDAHCL